MTAKQINLMLQVFKDGEVMWSNLTAGQKRVKTTLVKSGMLESCGHKIKLTDKGRKALTSVY